MDIIFVGFFMSTFFYFTIALIVLINEWFMNGSSVFFSISYSLMWPNVFRRILVNWWGDMTLRDLPFYMIEEFGRGFTAARHGKRYQCH